MIAVLLILDKCNLYISQNTKFVKTKDMKIVRTVVASSFLPLNHMGDNSKIAITPLALKH